MLVLLFAVAAVSAVRGLWSPCGLSMLSALNPVAERARGHRFATTAGWYLAGAVLGGALLGAGCAVGAFAITWLGMPAALAWWVVLAGGMVAAASDAGVAGWLLPIHPRQVDERWLTVYRRWFYAGGFGVQIGTGFATYIMTAGVYLTALLAVVSAAPAAAFAAGVAFGTVRGLGLLVVAPAGDERRLHAVMARVDSWAPATRLGALLVCVATALSAAWQLAGAVLTGALVVVAAGAFAGLRSNRAGRRAGAET